MTITHAQTVRPTAGHIDHVVLGYHSDDSVEKARSEFEDALAIGDWIDMPVEDGQTRGIYSPRAGLRLITPTSPDSPLAEHLRTRGEGFVSFCVDVEDFDGTYERAANLGLSPRLLPQSDAGVGKPFRSARQAHIGQIGSADVSFGHFELNEAVPVGSRPYAGAIDHVGFAYATIDAREDARRAFASVFDLDDWMDVGVVYELVKVNVSWSSGIELICPAEPGGQIPFMDRDVDTDGFNVLVFGVDDLDAEVERLRQRGYEPILLPRVPDIVFELYDVSREAYLGQIGSVATILGEFAPK